MLAFHPLWSRDKASSSAAWVLDQHNRDGRNPAQLIPGLSYLHRLGQTHMHALLQKLFQVGGVLVDCNACVCNPLLSLISVDQGGHLELDIVLLCDVGFDIVQDVGIDSFDERIVLDVLPASCREVLIFGPPPASGSLLYPIKITTWLFILVPGSGLNLVAVLHNRFMLLDFVMCRESVENIDMPLLVKRQSLHGHTFISHRLGDVRSSRPSIGQLSRCVTSCRSVQHVTGPMPNVADAVLHPPYTLSHSLHHGQPGFHQQVPECLESHFC